MSSAEAAETLAALCVGGDREPGGEETYLAMLRNATTVDRVVDALRILGQLRYEDEIGRLARRAKAIEALKACPAAPSAPVRLVDSVLPLTPRAGRDSDKGRGRGGLGLEDPEPWPKPVTGSELLNDLEACFIRHVALPPGGAAALALWCAFTYVFEAFDTCPLLVLSSPEKRCGKTTTMTLLTHVCRRVVSTSNVSPAALYRLVEAEQPTLLFDEADAAFGAKRSGDKREELRAILNSGHTRSMAFAIRCRGDDHEPARFSTWAPKAVALIGRLPDTLEDRSITVPMRRKLPDEVVERYRADKLSERLLPLRRKATRWGREALEELRNREPRVPTGLDDRKADNWRPLLAIADSAGNRWTTEARRAIGLLDAASPTADEEGSAGVLLLGDLREVFDRCGTANVFTESILAELLELEDRPWGEWGRARKPITPRGISRLLKPFGIRSRDVRIGEENKKGYRRADLEEAWSRYLPLSPSVTPRQSPSDGGLRDSPAATAGERGHGCEPAESPMTPGYVTVSRPESGEGGWEGTV